MEGFGSALTALLYLARYRSVQASRPGQLHKKAPAYAEVFRTIWMGCFLQNRKRPEKALKKSINETVQERDRVKIADIMNLQPGEFYGFIAEGNEKEILKSKFQINQEFWEDNFDFPILATEIDIQENYRKIIGEAKSITDFPENSGNNLINF